MPPPEPPVRPLRLVIYSVHYRPELVGVGKYSAEMAEWLAARGHEVTVVTAPPHYPQWAVQDGYRAGRYRREQLSQVTVLRCPIWLPRRLTPLRRILAHVSFALSSLVPLFRACLRRPDWVIVVEPTFFCLPGAWLVSRLLRLRLWLHVQDFELSAASNLGMVRGRALVRLGGALEGFFLRRPDRVSTLSDSMEQSLARFNVPPERRLVLPNWVDCKKIYPLPGPSSLRRELGIADDRLVLLYSGSFGRKHGLDLLIQVARRLADRTDFQFVLCGEGVERARLQAEAHDLRNVLWLPLQPAERLNDLLNLADIHLLPQRSAVADAVLPSKLTGMLASGRPIVATAEPQTPLAQVVTQAGMVVPPGDCAALAAALSHLGSDEPLRHRLGRAGRQYAETVLDSDPVLSRFEHELTRFH